MDFLRTVQERKKKENEKSHFSKVGMTHEGIASSLLYSVQVSQRGGSWRTAGNLSLYMGNFLLRIWE